MRHHAIPHKSFLATANKGLSSVGGVITAFLCTPTLYDWSVLTIQNFVTAHYVNDAAWLVSVLWFVIVGMGVFFGTAAALSMIFMAAALALASLFR